MPCSCRFIWLTHFQRANSNHPSFISFASYSSLKQLCLWAYGYNLKKNFLENLSGGKKKELQLFEIFLLMSQEDEWCFVTPCACTAQVMLDAYNTTVGREKEEWCTFCGRHCCLEITPGAPTRAFRLGSTFEANLLIFSTDNALVATWSAQAAAPCSLGWAGGVPQEQVVQLQISPPSPKSNQIKKSQPWTEGEQLSGPQQHLCPPALLLLLRGVKWAKAGTGCSASSQRRLEAQNVLGVAVHKVKCKYDLNTLSNLNFPFWDYKCNFLVLFFWWVFLFVCFGLCQLSWPCASLNFGTTPVKIA